MRLSPPTSRLSLLASLSLLLMAGQSARAQFLTADDFFNSGAQFYISNNIPLAKQRTEMGLQIYPDDDKLKKLEELLKKQQQQQQKDQQSKSQQGQQGQQKNQDQQQQQQDQTKKSQEQKDKEAQAKKDEEKKEQEAQQKKDQSGGETNEVADAKGAHQMTPQEAERLLNSQKGSEQYLALKPKDKPLPPNRVVKDW
jgi:outer membrane biosynthesis protein TonB